MANQRRRPSEYFLELFHVPKIIVTPSTEEVK